MTSFYNIDAVLRVYPSKHGIAEVLSSNVDQTRSFQVYFSKLPKLSTYTTVSDSKSFLCRSGVRCFTLRVVTNSQLVPTLVCPVLSILNLYLHCYLPGHLYRACFFTLRLLRGIHFKGNLGSESASASRTTIGWHRITVWEQVFSVNLARPNEKIRLLMSEVSWNVPTLMLVIFTWGCNFAHPIYNLNKNSILYL